MEKQTELSRFRKYLLFLVVSLSLLSCQEEELDSFSSELETTEIIPYQFTSLDENEIQENSFLQKNLFNKNPIQRQAKSQDANATYEIKLFGLSLQANLAQQISNDSIATYTFSLLDKNNFLEGKLANLVLVENKLSQESYTFFVTYNNWEEVSSGTSDMMEYSYRILTGDSSPKITEHHRATKSSNLCIDWEHPACLFTLDEVVITGPVRRTEPIYLSIAPSWDGGGDPLNDGSDFSPSLGGGGGGSSGGSRESFPTIPIEPKPKTPCEKIKDVFNKTQFKEDFLELFKKRNDAVEYGFTQDLIGPAMQGINNTSNSVDLYVLSSSVGTVHIHTDDLHSVFSPEDFLLFLKLLDRSAIDISSNYSIVVGTNGEGYMLTYEGTKADFEKMGNPLKHGGNSFWNINEDDLSDIGDYNDYLDDGMEQAEIFMNSINTEFLKDGLTLESLGFKLTELKFNNNGKLVSSKEVSLNKNKKVKKSKCK